MAIGNEYEGLWYVMRAWPEETFFARPMGPSVEYLIHSSTGMSMRIYGEIVEQQQTGSCNLYYGMNSSVCSCCIPFWRRESSGK